MATISGYCSVVTADMEEEEDHEDQCWKTIGLTNKNYHLFFSREGGRNVVKL